MKFFLLLNPPTATAQEHKVTMNKHKPKFYTPDRLKNAKEELLYYLEPFVPDNPIQGAIKLNVMWLFPKGKHKHGEWRITKPDTDNLEKMLKDCMTKLGFWNDDAQVVSEHVEKIWSNEPIGISIEIIQLPKIKEDLL